MRVLRAPLLLVVAMLALLLAGPAAPAAPPAPAGPAAPSAAPAGMSRFVVAIGGLRTSSRENWVRLGTYSLTADGKATESHFHWTQRSRVPRSYTGVTAADCGARNCQVQTANGFQATSSPQHLTGTYTVTGSVLHFDWDGNGWEEWNVSEPIAGKLAELTFRGSSFGATHGYGFGSNAAWTQRASMAQIASFDWSSLKHDYVLWKTDSGTPYLDQGAGSPFWNQDWTACTSARCLGGTTGGGDTQYYLSTANATSTDRRDTLWHWRTALADGRGEHCYTGNSHVKPMLEVIDSDGGFHGWVAVEASLNQTSPDQGTSADDIGVFEISQF
ncbi:hypothetical protein [Streptomyces sp. TS71-3]|uniref:hypothetical protein n=1 Tax=Streptomyces sp. TS71-3 TaxID=2733862 RepID=UPI001B068FAA|nr:hypothetical protein [Streptomyces sp. TS71-3]GHJ38621.1 hypothetical protein Sm713_42300 [Streptomyces sp. TS71-3]